MINNVMRRVCLKSIFIIIMCHSAQVFPQENDFEFSLGLGERYAGVGISGEYSLIKNIGVTAGFGAEGTRAGVDYYFRNVPEKLKYRISVGYGLVIEVDCVDCAQDEKYYSYMFGLGIKRTNFEYSVYYLDLKKYEDDNKVLEAKGFKTESIRKLSFSFGYIF